MSFFGELERFAADLYPYRWPITIAVALVLAGLLAVAYRRGYHRVLWRHRLATALVAAPVLAVAAPVGWYTLSPLWERSYLEEASPLAMVESIAPAAPMVEGTAEAPAPAAPMVEGGPEVPTPAAFAARVTHRGEFEGADDFHFGRGRALLIESAPGRYTLRFEDFSVRNGPDLYVYLSPSPDGYGDDSLNLGLLKATDGAFNYEVPEGTDVSRFRSAIIWCRQFSVLFAAAPLEEV